MLGQVYYDVEKIIDKKKIRGKDRYLVKWKGYPITQCTWEPLAHLENVMYMVNEFNSKFNMKDDNKIENYNKNEEDKEIKTDNKDNINKEKNIMQEESGINEKQNNNISREIFKTIKNEKQEKRNKKKKEKEKEEKKDKRISKKRKEINKKKKEEEKDEKNEEDEVKKEVEIIKKDGKENGEEKETEFTRKEIEDKEDINEFINRKRKNSESSLKSTEEDIDEIKEESILSENFIKNKELNEKIISVNFENGDLIALVERKEKDNKTKKEKIKTKDLKKTNPWILVNYYESNILFC